MHDEILAFLLLLGGLGCIIAWGICRVAAAVRSYRIGKEADAVKLHLIRGGRMPDEAPLSLARDYLSIRFLGILGNLLLAAGIAVMLAANLLIS